MSYSTLPEWYTPTGYRPGLVLARLNVSRRTRTRILGPTSLTGRPWHGTTYGYARGCSCQPCRDANREASRRKRGA